MLPGAALMGGMRNVNPPPRLPASGSTNKINLSGTVTLLAPPKFGTASQLLRAFLDSHQGRTLSLPCRSSSASGESSPCATVSTPIAPPELSSASSSEPGAVAVTASPSESSADSQATGNLVLSSGVFLLPHPDKAEKGGEDWYFISNTMRAVGVADGVGGWAEIGVDAGAYSRLLMASTSKAISSQSLELDAQQALVEAHAETKVQGSCTACVLAINGTKLHASNLGDSGYLVMRDGDAIFQTPQQQHSFNFPFQLGSEESMSDPPSAADLTSMDLRPGDIIVVGTDGLWDNCFPEEITSVINYCIQGGMDAIKSAQVMAHYARHRAADTKYASPFAYSAFQNGVSYLGGKMDDITVLVAFVKADKSSK